LDYPDGFVSVNVLRKDELGGIEGEFLKLWRATGLKAEKESICRAERLT
jgi:hypothetical protein